MMMIKNFSCTIKICLLFFLLMCELDFYSQNKTPNYTLNKVYIQLQKVKDYVVDINITVDLPFIRILPVNAKIYFKQPDKFKVESKSIAILPRQSFDQLNVILKDTNQFIANYQKIELINNTEATLINLIPLQDTTDLVLAKLWVDTKRNIILKSFLTNKSNGTIITEYVYGKHVDFALPDNMVLTVDVKKFKIPKSIAADINTNISKQDVKVRKNGKIIIKLTNYEINKGGEMFDKKK